MIEVSKLRKRYIFCSKCGAKNAADAKFCAKCGAKIVSSH